MRTRFLILFISALITTQAIANYGFTDQIAKNVIESPQLQSCLSGTDIRSEEFTYQVIDTIGDELPYKRYYTTSLADNFLIQDVVNEGLESIGGWRDNYTNYLTVSDFGGNNVNRIRFHLLLPDQTMESFYSADISNKTIVNLKRIKSPDPIMYYSVERDGRSSIREKFGTVGEISLNHGDTRLDLLTSNANVTNISNVTNVEGLKFAVYKNGTTYYFENIMRGGINKSDAIYKATRIIKPNGREILLKYSNTSGALLRVVDDLRNYLEFKNFIKDVDTYSVQYEYPQKIYRGRFKEISNTQNEAYLDKYISGNDLLEGQVIDITYDEYPWYNYKQNNRLETIYTISSVNSSNNNMEYYSYSLINLISAQVTVGGILQGKWEPRYAIPSLSEIKNPKNNLGTISYSSATNNWYHKIQQVAGPGGLNKVRRKLESGFVNDNTKKWEKKYSLTFDNYNKSNYAIYGDTKARKVNMSFSGFPCITYKSKPVSYVEYDIINEQIISLKDNNNNITTFTYDNYGRVLSVKEAVGTLLERTLSYTYNNDIQGYQIPTRIDMPLKLIENTLVNGLLTLIKEKSKISNEIRETRYSYDRGLISNIVDSDNSLSTRIRYDTYGLKTEVTKYRKNQLQNTIYRNYNGSGLPRYFSENNIETSIIYDSKNNIAVLTEKSGNKSRYKTFIYNNINQITEEKDFDGILTKYEYNDSGLLSKKIIGKVSYLYNYDVNSNLITINMVDSSNKLHHKKVYNNNGLISEEYDGSIITKLWKKYTYDINNNLVNISEPGNNIATKITKTYDQLDRVKSITDENSNIFSYSYDSLDNIIEYKAPNLYTSIRNYFFNKDLTKDISTDYGEKNYTYNSQSELKSITHANARKCLFGEYNIYGKYDSINCTDLTNTPINYNVNYNFSFDTYLNRLHSVISNNKANLTGSKFWGSNTFYGYDEFNRVKSKKQVVGIIQQDNTETGLWLDYSYTNSDNIKSITYPSGKVVSYNYTPTLGEDVSSIYINDNILLSLTYDFNLIKNITWANGNTSIFVYDNSFLLTSNTNTIKGKNSINLNYNYFDNGNIKNKSYNNLIQNFTYDNKGQLIKEDKYSGQNLLYTHNFSYNSNGNRLSFQSTGTQSPYPFTSASYSFITNSNKFSSIKHDGNNIKIAYEKTGELQLPDLIGNAIYDYNGRRSYQDKGLNSSFTSYTPQYNHQNQRVYSGLSSNLARQYIYNEDDKLLGEYNASGGVIVEYIWLGDKPIAAMFPDKTIYLISDQNNTPFLGIDPITNTVVWEWITDAFGVSKPSIEARNISLRFPGQYYDITTGLHYNINRYYSPILGRYIEPDPIDIDGGWNSYNYALNNPVNNSDSKGLIPILPVIGLTLTIDSMIDGMPPQGKLAKVASSVSNLFKKTPLSASVKQGIVNFKPSTPHGNSLKSGRAAELYSLRDRKSESVIKWGETTRGEDRFGVGKQKRYSDRFLDQNNAVYKKEASGTKLDMHRLQTEKILNHIETFGSRPPLNKTNY